MMRLQELHRACGRLLRETRGAAAAEFAIWVPVVMIPLMNVGDLSMYVYRSMQVQNAAQIGAQAGWRACSSASQTPATQNCSAFSNAVSAGVQNTSLGSKVTLASGYPQEGYYCTTTSGTLTLVGTSGTVATPPTTPSPDTCAAVSGASDPTVAPGDYITVKVTYSFTSIFSGLTVAALLPSPMTATAMTRIN
jgi:Flp pilus assembly protein TadG